MKYLIDIIMLSLLGGIVYYFGYVLGGAYDNTNDYKDLLAVGCSLSFLTYIWYRWA